MGVSVGLGVSVGVWVGISVSVDVWVGVLVGASLGVTVIVAVGVVLGVIDGVGVAVSLGVGDGVRLLMGKSGKVVKSVTQNTKRRDTQPKPSKSGIGVKSGEIGVGAMFTKRISTHSPVSSIAKGSTTAPGFSRPRRGNAGPGPVRTSIFARLVST